jgi:diguanylate cyclase (GGDEF)-like protein
MPQRTNKLVATVFGLLMVVFAYLLYDGYIEVKNTHEQAKNIIEEQQTKHRLITDMYMAARERSVILLTMNAEDDIFVLDELNLEMAKQASLFINARERLDHVSMSDEEREIFEASKSLVSENAPLQMVVSRLFMEEEREQARELLFERAIPGQRKVLDQIALMLSLYERNAEIIIGDIERRSQKATRDFQILALGFFVVTSIFLVYAYLAARREREILRRNAKEKAFQASHDPLTGLINRWEFENRLGQLIDNPVPGQSHIVLYLDLDQFKIVNDICGHHVGDELLIQIATILKPCLGDDDELARVGGDEYGIILRSADLSKAKQVADSIIQTISDYRFYWNKQTFRVGASIGIVEINEKTQAIEDALIHTDAACYAAKDGGRNRYHVYTESDRELIHRKSEMDRVVQLERALENDGFIIYAQPIVSTSDRNARINFELLIRLKTELGEPAPPGAFLPAAERFHKMVDIDRWVVNEALSILGDHPEFLDQVEYCSINISRQSLSDKKFLDGFMNSLKQYEKMGLARKLVLEITETTALINLTNANKMIARLKDMGVRFALDDFGSGLASFEYLKSLPVDYLKIDGMFIKDIADDPIDRAMVKSIHEIGSIMGKTTIAEFVENDDILRVLRAIGVEYAQGYGIGKPVPLLDVINSDLSLLQHAVA